MQVEHVEGIAIVTPGATPHNPRHLIGTTLIDLMHKGEKKVLLDLRSVGFLSSLDLATVVEAYREAAGRGVQYRLCDVDPRVVSVFETLKLSGLLKVHRDRAEALDALRKL